MNVILLSIVLAFPAAAPQASNQPARGKDADKLPMQKLDGEWTVTYAEADGKKIEGKEFTHVTIKNNVATCKHDGKERSWHLQFGPHNMVRCTEQIDGKTIAIANQEKRDPTDKSQHTHHGVYIASPEYFCLCMNRGRDHRSFTPTTGREDAPQSGAAPRFGGEQGPQRAHFVLILHRAGSAPATTSR